MMGISFRYMKLQKEEILYYINYLEKQIKSTKSDIQKKKYIDQKNSLLYLLLKDK
jgi:hypothetical protein